MVKEAFEGLRLLASLPRAGAGREKTHPFNWIHSRLFTKNHTMCGYRMAQRKWNETKQQQGTAGTGNMLCCYLVSFHFLWAILWLHPLVVKANKLILSCTEKMA